MNPIFSSQPTNFDESMMSGKSQTVKYSQTDNVCVPFKCDNKVVKTALNGHFHNYINRRGQMNKVNLLQHKLIVSFSENQHFTDRFVENKQLTQIISDGCLIIHPFV